MLSYNIMPSTYSKIIRWIFFWDNHTPPLDNVTLGPRDLLPPSIFSTSYLLPVSPNTFSPKSSNLLPEPEGLRWLVSNE